MIPFGYGVGDHRAFILDVSIESLIEVDPIKIVRLVCRRLNSRLPRCNKSYIDSFEANIIKHCLLKQLFDAHAGAYSDKEWARRIIITDKEGKAYMRQAEKICRKIKCYRISFSPEAVIWICHVRVYYSLLRYHKGKIKNHSNLKQAARWCNIPNPLNMLIQEIAHRLKACKKKCVFYQEHGKRFRRKHLEKWRQIAKEEEDKDTFNKISAIIQREHQQDFWQKLNYVTGKKKTRSTTTIQVEGQDGAIMERTTQDTVEQLIFSKVHEKRFTLAGEAPICNGALFQDFGYTANTYSSCG